jgi:hypothetical protein
MVVLELDAELEAAILEEANQRASTPENVAMTALRQRFLIHPPMPVPRDDWERELLAIAVDCGVSLPDSALTREEMYD